jgi:hypothetical protein
MDKNKDIPIGKYKPEAMTFFAMIHAVVLSISIC